MSRILVTGSASGLGYATAKDLLDQGHQVILHIRNSQRLDDIRTLLNQGADVVTGDLSELSEMCSIAEQVNQLGPMNTVIHNAGVNTGRAIMPVNVVAPYVLTALIKAPQQLIYLSSSMHFDGHPQIQDIDWLGHQSAGGYSDSKLLVTALALAAARYWPGVISHAVDPGWVPTRMGGPHATDDLQLGHRTQVWLASTSSPATQQGGYWHHQQHLAPHPAAEETNFQDALIAALEQATGIAWPSPAG